MENSLVVALIALAGSLVGNVVTIILAIIAAGHRRDLKDSIQTLKIEINGRVSELIEATRSEATLKERQAQSDQQRK